MRDHLPWKILATVLTLSWLLLSAVDLLEDLRFETGFCISSCFNISPAPRSPSKNKQIRLANDTVELANHHALSFGKIPDDDELESTAGEIFLFAYLESKAFRTQKDRRVFRI
jgi:hypothetical protein